jgi:serine/threonine protein phosphatase 1
MMTSVLGQACVPDSTRVYAIGDVHGCLDELLALHEIIRAELAAEPVEHPVWIYLGDYVDRGPQTRQVIDELCRRLDGPDNVHCLRGNHDQRLLDFLSVPHEHGERFLQFGGAATLASYDIVVDSQEVPTVEDYPELAAKLANHIGARHLRFLNELAFSHTIGDYYFVHAGIRPEVPLAEQTNEDQLNIRHDFLDHERSLEKVIIHGHTMCDEPQVRQNRINVDTMAVLSGTLTSVVLEGRTHRFIST